MAIFFQVVYLLVPKICLQIQKQANVTKINQILQDPPERTICWLAFQALVGVHKFWWGNTVDGAEIPFTTTVWMYPETL